MKRTLLVLVLLLFTAVSYSQVKVPDKVKAAFEKKFPNASSVKWESDDDDYSAYFASDSVNCFASFDEDGKWTETGVTVLYDNLPDAVKKSAKDKVKDNEIKNLFLVEDSEGQKYYEVDILKDGKTIEFYFNKDGSESDD